MADITRTTTVKRSRPHRNALVDLAKIIESFMQQIKLRAKFSAVITDADKVERAAERLRAVAAQSTNVTEQVSLVPSLPIKSKSRQEHVNHHDTRSSRANQLVEELCQACNWLTTTQALRGNESSGRRRESAIATRIAELHDRMGGLIKRPPH
jgi:hypothetical protein